MDYSYRQYLPGWVNLIDPLVERIEAINREFPGRNVRPVQIKEKFGGLRFYIGHDYKFTGPDDEAFRSALHELTEAIHKAENDSFAQCQDCDSPGSDRNIQGWYVTLCDKHYEERLAKRKRGDYS